MDKIKSLRKRHRLILDRVSNYLDDNLELLDEPDIQLDALNEVSIHGAAEYILNVCKRAKPSYSSCGIYRVYEPCFKATKICGPIIDLVLDFCFLRSEWYLEMETDISSLDDDEPEWDECMKLEYRRKPFQKINDTSVVEVLSMEEFWENPIAKKNRNVPANAQHALIIRPLIIGDWQVKEYVHARGSKISLLLTELQWILDLQTIGIKGELCLIGNQKNIWIDDAQHEMANGLLAVDGTADVCGFIDPPTSYLRPREISSVVIFLSSHAILLTNPNSVIF